MKKIILLLIILMNFVACSGFNDDEVDEIKIQVEKLEIDQSNSSVNLKIDESVKLSATVFYSNGTEGHRGVEWESSNPEAVKVDEEGLVTAILGGETVTVSAARGGTKTEIEIRTLGLSYYLIGSLSAQIDWDDSNPDNAMLKDETGKIYYMDIVIDDISEGTSEERKFKFSKEGVHYKALFEGETDFLTGMDKIEGTVVESLSTCKIKYVNGEYRLSLNTSDVENMTWSIVKTK